jgi:16S rRNA (guanine527-N7)-methyltransferase
VAEDRDRQEAAAQLGKSAQLATELIAGANELGLLLDASQAQRLLAITTALADWNQRINLTAITEPRAMLTHHLLDSLAVHEHLQGTRIADVGTGAGFPGLPLALLQPQRHFTLIDSVAKKLRFVAHAAQLADIHNVTLVHARSQDFPRDYPPPHAPFDTVLARAFKPLAELVKLVQPLCGPATRVLAMKGPRAEAEIAALGGGWRVEKVSELFVPGLDAERKLVTLRLAGPV